MATKKAQAPQAKTETVKLFISKVNTTVNKNGKLSIKTEEGHAVNPKGLFQYKITHIDHLADGVGAADADMLKNAIAKSTDDNFLVLEVQAVKAGEWVLDSNGEKIEDPTSESGFQVYTVDHFRTVNTELELGQDAQEYIASINAKIDYDVARAKRMNKRTAKKATPVVKEEIIEDEELG